MAKSKPKPDDPAQFKRFLEAAKQAEADETGREFQKAFEKVVRPAEKPKTD